MLAMTRILTFQILFLACLVGYSIAFRRSSLQSRSRLSMTATELKSATIAFGLFVSPVHAATMMGSAATTFGSASYTPPPLVISSSDNTRNKAPPPSSTTAKPVSYNTCTLFLMYYNLVFHNIFLDFTHVIGAAASI